MLRVALNVALVLLVLSHIGYAQRAGRPRAASQPETKPTKPIEAQVEQARSYYENQPINLSLDKLPAQYHGVDPEKLYQAFEKRLKSEKKDEFETTEAFNKRVTEGRKAPLIGNLTQDSLMAFESDKLDTYYNADTGIFNISLDLKSTLVGIKTGGDSRSLWLKMVSRPKTTYTASNAYGKEVTVEKEFTHLYALKFGNYLEFAKQTSLPSSLPDEFNEYKIQSKLQLDVDTAKKIKPVLRALVIIKLVEPYISEGFLSHKPTISDPRDSLTVFENIESRLVEVWLYDPTTGDIYLKIKQGGSLPAITEIRSAEGLQVYDVGDLNNKVIKKPMPKYPATAKGARVTGIVVVEVEVDATGSVIVAAANNGPILLRQAAVDAARLAVFRPMLIDGIPVRFRGRLTYNFTL